MAFQIRPAHYSDTSALLALATSVSARGFLTLPNTEKGLEELLDDTEGHYLFVLEDEKKVIGSSLIVARHGTAQSPHLYLQLDRTGQKLKLRSETWGRTELGGLILDPSYRGHPEKLGKRLSYVRLFFIGKNPQLFCPEILAELLPPFTPDGRSLFWEALGKKFTGLDYQEADEMSRRDKSFIRQFFPQGEININSLPAETRAVIGTPGPETMAVTKILQAVGFQYLRQIDPFDGGPHYGAKQGDIRYDLVEKFLLTDTKVVIIP